MNWPFVNAAFIEDVARPTAPAATFWGPMDQDDRIANLEKLVADLAERVAGIAAVAGSEDAIDGRHPDLIRRAPSDGSDRLRQAAPQKDRRASGACLAVAMVMVIVLAIAAIGAMQGLGNQLKGTFPNASTAR